MKEGYKLIHDLEYRNQGQGREPRPVRPIPRRTQADPGRAWRQLEGGSLPRGSKVSKLDLDCRSNFVDGHQVVDGGRRRLTGEEVGWS